MLSLPLGPRSLTGDLTARPVLYEVMGTSISIPAPRFSTQLRNTSGQSSKFKDDSTKIEVLRLLVGAGESSGAHGG